jgi:Dynamin family
MTDHLSLAIAAVVDRAVSQARTPATAAQLREVKARMEAPLRLAIAGKVKAGKSTLLNALLGEELAPTDAGECTKVVTWYVESHTPRVRLFPRQGEPRDRPYSRDQGALQVDLGGLDPAEVDHLEVGWPTSKLRDLTILDTPGIASISADISARTHQALSGEDGRVPVADAVLYLLRHAHASDIRFLESFHDNDLAFGTPMNAVGVLSRADEIGSCRLDALDVAERVALRYEGDPRLRRLCPVVVPVDGLLGHAATTLRESEFALLARVAAATPEEIGELLLTVDRFTSRQTPVAVTELERAHLLSRLGLFGVRLSVELIRSGAAPTAMELSKDLARRSGITRLRSILSRQFEDRSRVLKARSAIAALEDLLNADACEGSSGLLAQVEQISSSAHEFEEARLLDQLRSGGIQMGVDRTDRLDRLMGGSGHDVASRLGLGADTGEENVRRAALQELALWQRVAEHPLSSRSTQVAARAATRTLEGLVAAVAPAGQMSPSRNA